MNVMPIIRSIFVFPHHNFVITPSPLRMTWVRGQGMPEKKKNRLVNLWTAGDFAKS